MAILHCEHFDTYGTGTDSQPAVAALITRGYVLQGTTGPNLATAGRSGNRLSFSAASANTGILRWFLPAPRNVLGVGVAVRAGATPTADIHTNMGVHTSNTPTGYGIRWVVNPELGVSLFNGTTFIAKSAPALLNSASFRWVEMKLDAVAGAAQVRIEGTEVISATGLTFAAPENVALGRQGGSGSVSLNYDDWVIWDDTGDTSNDWLGDTFVLVDPPIADSGIVNDWSPSTGVDKWALVDELVPNDGDFIVGNSPGDAQELICGTPTLPAGSVIAVGTQVRAAKTDAGTSVIRVGVASGTSVDESGDYSVPATPGTFMHIANENPNGSVPWTISAAIAARPRVERVS